MIILCGKQIAASLFDILPSPHKTNGAKLKCSPNQPLYMFRYDAPIMRVCVCLCEGEVIERERERERERESCCHHNKLSTDWGIQIKYFIKYIKKHCRGDCGALYYILFKCL